MAAEEPSTRSLETGAACDPAGLREHLRTRLPDYACPLFLRLVGSLIVAGAGVAKVVPAKPPKSPSYKLVKPLVVSNSFHLAGALGDRHDHGVQDTNGADDDGDGRGEPGHRVDEARA